MNETIHETKEESQVYEISHGEKRRALFKIYLFMLIILGLTFFAMGMQMMLMLEQSTPVEGEGYSVTISYVPPVHEEEESIVELSPSLSDGMEAEEEVETYVYYDVPLSDHIQRYIQDVCKGFEVQYPHVLATMKTESGFEPSAISPPNSNGSRDYGIMQVNSGNHLWLEKTLGIIDWLDIYENILAGVYILSHYNHFEDDFRGIALCYNMGPVRGQTLYKEGQDTRYSEVAVQALHELEIREDTP